MDRVSYARFLELIRQEAAFYEDLGRSRAIRPRWEENQLLVDIYWKLMSAATEQWIQTRLRSVHDAIDLWLRAEVVTHGPKLFRPTLDQCMAMEQITPRIATTDYHQPYPVMIVEFPADYRRQRTCPAMGGGTESPECVIIGFHEAPVSAVWADTVYSSGRIVRVAMLPSDASIEAGIVRECGEDSYAEVEAFDLPHRIVLAGVLRVAVNAMLLLAEFGSRRVGPTNPPHYERVRRHLEVSRRKGQGLDQARRDLRLAPQLYGFAQQIVLYERDGGTDAEPHGEPGSPRRPHWRRGHWKMHAHGPSRSLRKRIFIRPTLVNHHLLHGPEPAAGVLYRIH